MCGLFRSDVIIASNDVAKTNAHEDCESWVLHIPIRVAFTYFKLKQLIRLIKLFRDTVWTMQNFPNRSDIQEPRKNRDSVDQVNIYLSWYMLPSTAIAVNHTDCTQFLHASSESFGY